MAETGLRIRQRGRGLPLEASHICDRSRTIEPGHGRRRLGCFRRARRLRALRLRARQSGVAEVAAGCWVGGGAAAAADRATAGVPAGRARSSQRPFTMRIPRELHLLNVARTAEFRTQMSSIS